ncbi:MerR family DNA-binding transcriptional regulator [Fusobacterium sp. PH5-44]|uniref:MerR family DNA-binding transcriptional regulator n=1 Tax=unclassified Fusobacterium TaxID=2648384 RepID=UPI003D223F6B
MLKKNLLSIGEVSKITGVHVSSLRYYEKIGVLKPAYVDPENKYRYYEYTQLYILRAIQGSIMLGIPLKEFIDYTDNEGSVILFEKLMELSKVYSEKKIEEIKSNFRRIEFLQSKLRNNQKLLSTKSSIIQKIEEKLYFVYPIRYSSKAEIHLNFAKLFSLVKEKDCIVTHEAGVLHIYDNGRKERYLYVEINSFSGDKCKNIISIPTLKYSIKHVSRGSIENIENEFPELFKMNYRKYIMETNFLTEKIDINNIQAELRCSLPKKK